MIKFLRFALFSLVLFASCTVQQPYVPQALYLREANVASLDNTQVPELSISRVETDGNKVRLFAHLLNGQGDFINLTSSTSKQNWCAVVDQFGGRDNAIANYQVLETGNNFIEEPTAYALVLDHSGSMAYRVKDMQDAVENFIRNKRPQDAISIVKYDKNARVEVPSQTDLGFLLSAFQKNGLNGYGGVTAIINGIHEGIESIRNAPQRKKLVISFTDGGDNSSTITKEYLIWLSQSLQIPICTIDLGSSVSNNFMKEIASSTGGTYNYMMFANEFPNVFTDIKNRLSKSYVIEYTSPGLGNHQVSLTFCHPSGPLTASANYSNLPVSTFAPIKDAPPISRPPKTDGKPVRPIASKPSKQLVNRPVQQASLGNKGNTSQKPAIENNFSSKPNTPRPPKPKPSPTKPINNNSNEGSSRPGNLTKPNSSVTVGGNSSNTSGNTNQGSSRPGNLTKPNSSVTVGGNTPNSGLGNKGSGKGTFKPNNLPTLGTSTNVGRNNSYLLDVVFKTGTAEINTSQSEQAINALVAQLNAKPNLKATLEVYTDNFIQPSNAMALTQQRGEVIKNSIIQKGVAANRISVSGKGSANPVADNSTAEGRKQNNRVVVRFN
jgi:outer membrane protein OmpA-like peptidoglycan-associated protein